VDHKNINIVDANRKTSQLQTMKIYTFLFLPLHFRETGAHNCWIGVFPYVAFVQISTICQKGRKGTKKRPSIISCFLTSLGKKGTSILNQNSGNRTKFAISSKGKGNPVIN
jgi:hypothetical protein